MSLFLWVVVSAALSGFFALTSYTLRAFRRLPLDEAFEGERGKQRYQELERHLMAYRLAMSFGRSLANLSLTLAMLCLLNAPVRSWGRMVGAVAGAAGIVAILGVAIPHAWSAYAGEKVLAATFPVVRVLRWVLQPAAFLMGLFDVPVRRLAGATERDGEAGGNAKQEILQAASEGQAEGAVDAEEVQMIESVMEFGDTQADEIMTPRTEVFALPTDTSWETATAQVVEAGHTRVPLYEGDLDNIAGILYAKDLLRHLGQPNPPPLRQIMRQPLFVPETKRLDDLLRDFKARKFHLAVVLDEYGGTAGIVTIEDVVEEIVGDIADEYDQAEPVLMHRIDEDRAEVDGRMHIDDLNDAMEITVPEDEDYDTVAGFVFSELGHIPDVNEKLAAYGAQFTVLAADERKITRLLVERIRPGEAGAGP